MSGLTVGINLLWLVPGAVGGSEQSAVAGLHGMQALASPDLDVRLFVLRSFVDAHPDLVAAFPTEVLPCSGRFRPARIAAEATWLARRTRGLDVVHHAGGTAPARPATAPYVLTVHDLQPLEQNVTHGGLKRAYLRRVVPRSMRRAKAVIVPSDFVRSTVLARVDLDPNIVVTIPHCVEPIAGPVTPPEVLRVRYRLEGPVVLYPAITYPHKNHVTLIEAFAAVHRHHPAAVLVLPGGEGACEAGVQAQVERLGLTDCVRRLGRISEADKNGLFEMAQVVAVPSTYEGFGIPAAEAMSAGVALVAARAASLPEVVGEAGILLDPTDVPAWAEAITGLLADPEERARLAGLGRARAGRFLGTANASALADLYRRVCARGERSD